MKNTEGKTLDFTEFQSSTKKDWKARAEIELKNNSVTTLDWKPFNHNEKISLEPLYSFEDMSGLGYLQAFHSYRSNHRGWKGFEKIDANDPDIERKIETSRISGSEGIILFNADRENLSKKTQLLRNYPLDLSIETTAPSQILEIVHRDDISLKYIVGEYSENFSIPGFSNKNPDCRPICISLKGSGIDHQLLDFVSQMNRLFESASGETLASGILLKKVFVFTKTGNEFFPEIAKLRSLRILTEALWTAYISDKTERNFDIEILCESELYADSSYEPHGNMIKGTCAAMASIMGGCDAIIVESEGSDQTQNVARQISNILREEAYLGKVADPAGGSYYIENLTHQLVTDTWNRFQALQTGN